MLAPTALSWPGAPQFQEGTGTRFLLRVMFSSSLCMFSRSTVSAFCVFKASSHLASLCSSCARQENERRKASEGRLLECPSPLARALSGDTIIYRWSPCLCNYSSTHNKGKRLRLHLRRPDSDLLKIEQALSHEIRLVRFGARS